MKTLQQQLVVPFLFLMGLVSGSPLPQDPNTEVELLPVGDLPSQEDVEVIGAGGDRPVLVLLNTGNQFPVLPRIPQIPNFDFEGFGKFPQIPSSFGSFGSEDIPKIDLGDIFTTVEEDETSAGSPGSRSCGLICQVFKTLEGQLGVVQGQIDTINTELHGLGGGEREEGEYDHHNTTYDEKVLPDGSVVRINRTTIHDTDEEGNGFFFQSSVHHVFQEGDEEESDETDEKEEDAEVTTESEPEQLPVEENDEENVIPLDIIEEIDPSENEIDEKFPTLDVSDVDSGLFE
jgi:hypothetical protein